ncbi:hypothetical protein UACE39S_05494 [Ureibacillus acetophenoni]
MASMNGKKMRLKFKLVFHILIALIGFISVILHVVYSPDPLVSLTKFTIHSNLLVSITFMFSSFAILSRRDRNSILEYFKNCSIIYMSICILTYHFLLSSGGEYTGTRIITNFTLHYLIPILVFINWFVFEIKEKYSLNFIFYWMIYPFLYSVVSLVRGLIDGFYPYFFLNPNGEIPVGVGSYTNVALFIIAYLCVYFILGFLLITLNGVFLKIKNNIDTTSKHVVERAEVQN